MAQAEQVHDVPIPAGDAVDGGEDLGELERLEVALSVLRAVRQAHGAGRTAVRLGVEAGRIGLGRSSIAPEKVDGRFDDPAWREHPLYRRLMQLYLAASRSLEELTDAADLDWRNAERARFGVNVLTSSLAPTNTLLGNPKAIKRAFETGGLSLVRGMRSFATDVRHNRGMPRQVDEGVFRVGRDLAVTPGSVVYRNELCEVIQYRPSTPQVKARPVVIVVPQINKFYFLDLAPRRSFVEYIVGRGFQVFLLSWRNPRPEHRSWGLDDYAGAVLEGLDVARAVTGSDDANLLGMCAGGVTSAGALSHLAAHDDQRVHTASFGVTLLDFDVPAAIGMFGSPRLVGLAKRTSNDRGVLEAKAMSQLFLWLRPNELVWNYWVNNNLMGEPPPPFDVLAWNSDGTNLPGRLHGQFLDIFLHNQMIEPGSLRVLGTPVDLRAIRCETYVTGALTDHLTPWQGCYRTTQLLGGPSTFVLSHAGHIQSIVNPPGNPRAHYYVGPPPGLDPDAWREAAEDRPGSWWEHWADWLDTRSGPEVEAPAQPGSAQHPPLYDAPGRYVFD